MAKTGDLLGSKAPINSYKLEKMTKSLTFSNEKARRELGWEPLDVLENYKRCLMAIFRFTQEKQLKICVFEEKNIILQWILLDFGALS